MSPIYEYLCLSCNHETESWQKMNDPSPLCEKCNGETRRQIGTGTDFILKGDQRGFYGKKYGQSYTGGAFGNFSRKARKNK